MKELGVSKLRDLKKKELLQQGTRIRELLLARQFKEPEILVVHETPGYMV